MDRVLAYKFRIYPDAKRQSEIELQLVLAKEFYNLLLEKSMDSYKEGHGSVSMASLNAFAKGIEKDTKYLQLYSQVRCEIKYRLLKAYQNFFRRVRERQAGKKVRAGFPRFKSADRYRSLTYPQDNGAFSIETERKTDMLRVSRIGRMKIDLHRELWGKIKTMTIKREGKYYYAIFTTATETFPPKIEDTNTVGIDIGLHNFIALSDGTTVQKPKFFKKRAKRIAKWQRTIARRRKGSKRRQAARYKLQREWARVTNQSNDFMHKLSNELVHGSYTSFAVEALNIQNMERNHRLAQSIQNASWNSFVQMLSYKAENAGMEVIKVDARDTTRTCSNCGNIMEMPLSAREYICDRCGAQIGRDVNSAINVRERARAGHARSHARGDTNLYGAKGAASCVKEPRTYPGSNSGGSLGL